MMFWQYLRHSTPKNYMYCHTYNQTENTIFTKNDDSALFGGIYNPFMATNTMHYWTMLYDFSTVHSNCPVYNAHNYRTDTHQNCTKATPKLRQKITTQPQCSQWDFHLNNILLYICKSKPICTIMCVQ